VQLWGVRADEGEESADGLESERREARVSLFRRTAVLLIDQHDIRWHARTSHNGLPGHLLRIDFHEIAPSPVHDASSSILPALNFEHFGQCPTAIVTEV
jgi:hypothetical protein